jgi:hypothetical protein
VLQLPGGQRRAQPVLGIVGQPQMSHGAPRVGQRRLHGMDAEDQRLPVLGRCAAMPGWAMLVAVGHVLGALELANTCWLKRGAGGLAHTCRFVVDRE